MRQELTVGKPAAPAPIEYRNEQDDDSHEIADAIRAVEELRGAVEQRTGATDERLTAELGALTERLDQLETRIQRPITASRPEDSLERRAFLNFLRYGKDGLQPDEVRALVVGDDTKAGYLAHPEMPQEMIRLLVEFSPVRSVATVRTTSKASVILPKRTGITNAKWEGEIEESEKSEPAFGQVEIPVWGMRTYTDISMTLLEDADYPIEAELNQAFAEDFGKKEGAAFVNGNGVKQPRGFMQHPDIAPVANGHATTLMVDGLIDLFHAMPAAYRNRGAWLMNSKTIGTVRKLKYTDGKHLWQDSLAAGNPPTILGRPVFDTPDMPDIGSGTYPIAFGDFASAYRIQDRIALTVMRDPFTLATKNLVRFHARRRTGGDVIKAEALRKLHMST